jgi:hypothetical protein
MFGQHCGLLLCNAASLQGKLTNAFIALYNTYELRFVPMSGLLGQAEPGSSMTAVAPAAAIVSD